MRIYKTYLKNWTPPTILLHVIKIIRTASLHTFPPPLICWAKKAAQKACFNRVEKTEMRPFPATVAAADDGLESRRGSGAFFALVVAARNSRATRRILGRRAENKSAEAQCTRAPVNIRRKEKTKWWRRQGEKEGGKARRYSISPQIRFEWN